MAPDVCRCARWANDFRDGREAGGRPLFRKPNGDPQKTGWTGYDCSVPICVQVSHQRDESNPFPPNIGPGTRMSDPRVQDVEEGICWSLPLVYVTGGVEGNKKIAHLLQGLFLGLISPHCRGRLSVSPGGAIL